MSLKSITNAVLVSLLLAGCAYFVSWDDVSRPNIGRPVEEIIALWKHPYEVRQIDATTREYRYDLRRLDPSCVHYWLVDEHGIIIGYHYKGYCRPIG